MSKEVEMNFKVPTDRIIPGTTVFELYDTHGLPLSVSAMLAKERGCVIDWNSFSVLAIARGWKRSTVLSRVSEAMSDAGFDPPFMEVNFERCEREAA